MTRLGELLPPATRAELAEMSRELAPAKRHAVSVTRAPSYAAVASRGGATLADIVSELHLAAAFRGAPVFRGPRRYAWQRCHDAAGTFYRCRVMWWGRFDLNASRVVLANTLPALWDSLADRELLPRDVWADDGAFLAFLAVGNVGPRRDRSHRVPLGELARGTREHWHAWHPRRYRAADGTDWQLVRYANGTRGLAPRDPKLRDA